MKPRALQGNEARPYHHGDLRNALIEAGLRLLDARGPDGAQDDPGLREVAREVGVSPTAIYRHFPDKHALKSALATAGLVRLAQRQQQAFGHKVHEVEIIEREHIRRADHEQHPVLRYPQ